MLVRGKSYRLWQLTDVSRCILSFASFGFFKRNISQIQLYEYTTRWVHLAHDRSYIKVIISLFLPFSQLKFLCFSFFRFFFERPNRHINRNRMLIHWFNPSHMGSRDLATHPFLLPARVCLNRKLKVKLEPGREPNYSNRECACLNQHLGSQVKLPFFIFQFLIHPGSYWALAPILSFSGIVKMTHASASCQWSLVTLCWARWLQGHSHPASSWLTGTLLSVKASLFLACVFHVMPRFISQIFDWKEK